MSEDTKGAMRVVRVDAAKGEITLSGDHVDLFRVGETIGDALLRANEKTGAKLNDDFIGIPDAHRPVHAYNYAEEFMMCGANSGLAIHGETAVPGSVTCPKCIAAIVERIAPKRRDYYALACADGVVRSGAFVGWTSRGDFAASEGTDCGCRKGGHYPVKVHGETP